MKYITRYSMGDLQITGCISYETLIWRYISSNITNQGKFYHLPFNQWDKGMAPELMDGCREDILSSDLSTSGKQFLVRLQAYIQVLFLYIYIGKSKFTIGIVPGSSNGLFCAGVDK